ncbi:MAG: hypothetical protein ACJAT9_001475 [Polaribacter sp.]|jgi:hypothetical protein
MVDVISNADEASGVVVPIPTWAYVVAVNNTAAKSVKICFIGMFFNSVFDLLVIVLLPFLKNKNRPLTRH